MKLNLSTKITIGFSIMLLLILLLGGNSYISLSSSMVSLTNIENASQRMILAMQIENEYTGAIAAIRGYIAYGDERFYSQTSEKLSKALELEKQLLQLARPEKKKDIEQLVTDTANYNQIVISNLLPKIRDQYKEQNAGNTARALKLKDEVGATARTLVPVAERIMKTLNEAGQNNSAIVKKDLADAREDTNGVMKTALIIAVCSLVICIILSLTMTKMIKSPITVLLESARAFSKGDLSKKVGISTQDELGELAAAINQMRDNFRIMLSEISKASEQVAASSEQLTASTEQSAQASNQVAGIIAKVAYGVENQVRSLSDAGRAVEEMSVSIQQVTATANKVFATANHTVDAASEGDKAISLAISQMSNIEDTVTKSAKVVIKLGDRSNEIGQIVNTISGIAGQTNLLALNAAIEAARAGEQGRGFAVVAEEVRKLAEQSQEAAKQIADLIKEIQLETNQAVAAMNDGTKEVKVGAEVVGQAGKTFTEIMALTNGVSNQIREMSAAMNQIANGSNQIVVAVRTIDEVCKETASQTQNVAAATEEQSASTEEIASASQALATMSEELQQAVNKFKL